MVISLFIFLMGLILGSFYNVVIYRLPNNISITKGWSMCPNCKTTLKAADLIPVFSQLVLLRGKCRSCDEIISIRYPIIELTTGLMFLLAYTLGGISTLTIQYQMLWSMLIIVAMIDFDYNVICDSVLIVFAVIAGTIRIVIGTDFADYFGGALLGFAIYLLIYLVSRMVYGYEAFGMGDVLFLTVIGLYMGIGKTLLVSMLSFFIALIGIGIMKLVKKKIRRKQILPFGPYICIAALIASVFGDSIIHGYLFLI